MALSISTNSSAQTGVLSVIATHFWFKCFGTLGFIGVFFSAYIFLLKHPFYPVFIIPATMIDQLIGIEPWALPFYFSLWFYTSLPIMLMTTRQDIVWYGVWVGGLCLAALTIFYFWPSAVPPVNIDWALYPGLSFLKGIDAAGNACPSLHVAAAIFTGVWLHRYMATSGNGWRIFNTCWCIAIVYSTMATKQHMAIDVAGGICLALVFIWSIGRAGKAGIPGTAWAYARK